MAMPISDMTVRTSAKSTLIMPGSDDEIRNALNRAEQHIVGGAERIEHRGLLSEHREQLLVRDGDQRVDVLLQFEDPLIRRRHALLEAERLGDDRNGENSISRATSATTGAPPVPVPPPMPAVMNTMSAPSRTSAMRSRSSSAASTTDLGIGTGAQALGDGAELQGGSRLEALERLRIGVRRDTNSTPSTPRSIMCCTALPPPPPDADHLDHRVLRCAVYQFEHVCVLHRRRCCPRRVGAQKLLRHQPMSRSTMPSFVGGAMARASRPALQPPAVKQQAHAGGIDGIADDVRQPLHVPRHADGYGLVEDLFRELHHALDLRRPAREHDSRRDQILVARTAQLRLHQREQLVVARLDHFGEGLTGQGARRLLADARAP